MKKTIESIEQKIKEIQKELESLKKMTSKIDVSYVSDCLLNYYKTGQPDMSKYLETIRYDHYFEIIEMYYNKRYTIEQIAELLYRDTTTIVRNKRRLLERLQREIETR